MSDYRMDIRGKIGLSEYSNIHDYFGVVDKDDNFTITLNNKSDDQVNIINSMLRDSNFFIYDEGYDNMGTYYISAYKIK